MLAQRFLIDQVKFDIFQVQKHKEQCCIPANNKMPLSSKALEKQTLNQLNREITFKTARLI